MKIQYRHNNGYTYMLAIDAENNHADIYMMDGSEDFPILADENEIKMYLANIAPYIDQWSGAENEMDDDELAEFLNWLDSDENDYDVCDGEYDTDVPSYPTEKTYYKVLSLNTCFIEPKEVWFRTEEEAKEAVADSDTSTYEGPVTVSDPDEIERIEKSITDREEAARLIREENDAMSSRPETMTDAELEEIVSSVVNETLSLFEDN